MSIFSEPMQPNSAHVETIGEYFVALLVQLWDQGEGFSGKRPFGDSGWEWELHDAIGVDDPRGAHNVILEALKGAELS